MKGVTSFLKPGVLGPVGLLRKESYRLGCFGGPMHLGYGPVSCC